jgi:hypothetical protein
MVRPGAIRCAVSIVLLLASLGWTQTARNAPSTSFGMAGVLEQHSLWL